MKRAGLLLVGLALVVGTAACGSYRAERQGRQVGDALCDLRNVDDADDVDRALARLERDMRDVDRIVGRPLEEDLEDIDENITDLIEHARQGNDALARQDISVIQRNVAAIRAQLATEGEAAYDGILEGLADCDY